MRGPRALFVCLILLVTVLQLPLAISDPGWLAGWNHRVMITIDADDIDTPLTHFPVLIKLSDSSGVNGTDVTFIFDEVESNSLRIAVTKSDGLTELYVEVEDWNNITEKAYLWVSKSDWTLSNLTDTIIYLYYDNEHADNTDQVGIVGSVPGETVWDEYFISVLHLSESSGSFLDSTDNNNDASAQGTVNRGIQRIDGGVDLPGTDDYVRIETTGLLDSLSEATIEILAYLDVLGADRCIMGDWGTVETTLFYYDLSPNNKWRALFRNSNNDAWGGYFGTVAPSGAWYQMGATYKRADFVYGYENGVKTQLQATSDHPLKNPNIKYWLGVDGVIGRDLDGKLDEARLSSIARDESWMEVTYETGRDHLLYFGEEEIRVIITVPTSLFGAGFNSSIPYVSLFWAWNSSQDIDFFEVQNSTDKVSWEYLGQNTSREYHDFQVVNGTERYYRVRACNYTGVGWDNSTWTDIDFEKVHFLPTGPAIETEVNVTGAWVDYNFTSIVTVVGDNVTGFLNSTYFKDGDFYSAYEVTGAPGYDIRFNVTGLPDNLICICLDLFMYYDGSAGHTFQIEVWNFTDSNWDFIEVIPDECCQWFNNTLECVPDDYVQNGTLMGRFYHPSPGNVNHRWGIDYGRLRVYVPYEVECEEVPATLAMGRYYALAIILLILGLLLGLGMRGKR